MKNNNNANKLYNIKIIQTGLYTEVIYFHDKIFYRNENRELKKVNDEEIEEIKEIDIIEEQEEKTRGIESIKKSKTNLRRLINSNLDQYQEKDKFLTLTYANEMKDRNKAYVDLKRFLEKVRYHFGKQVQYIGVMELQDGSRRKDKDKTKATNNIHWHLLIFNMPYVKKKELQRLWGKGIIDIRKIENYKDIAGYLANYLGDEILLSKKEKKSYTTSKNLIRPKITVTRNYDEMLRVLFNGKIEYSSNGNNAYSGNYTYYKLKNNEIIKLNNN